VFNLKDDIDTLTRFKRETPKFLGRLRKTGGPIVLTVNGRAEIVIQDADAYQEMMRRARRALHEAEVAAIKEGLTDADAGRGRPATEVFRDLDARLKAMMKARRASA